MVKLRDALLSLILLCQSMNSYVGRKPTSGNIPRTNKRIIINGDARFTPIRQKRNNKSILHC